MLTSMTNSVHRGSKFKGHKHNSCETHSLYICMCASLTLQNSGSRWYTKDQRSLRIDQFYWVKVQSNVLKCRTQGTQDQIVKCMYGMEICQLKVNLKRTTVRGQVVWWSIQWCGGQYSGLEEFQELFGFAWKIWREAEMTCIAAWSSRFVASDLLRGENQFVVAPSRTEATNAPGFKSWWWMGKSSSLWCLDHALRASWWFSSLITLQKSLS